MNAYAYACLCRYLAQARYIYGRRKVPTLNMLDWLVRLLARVGPAVRAAAAARGHCATACDLIALGG